MPVKIFVFVCIQIVDAETGKTLGTNEEGEIWIRGPQVSTGYLNMPAETEHMFLKDGWVRTGNYTFYHLILWGPARSTVHPPP